MGLGELCNFVSYAFAPVALVTPLGGLSVLLSSVLAEKYLKENINFFTKIGSALVIIGSAMIVIHAPKEGNVQTLADVSMMMAHPLFCTYLLFAFVTSLILVYCYAPTYGSKNVLVYIGICSIIGSLSVISCKGVAIGLRQQFSGEESQLGNPMLWVLIIALISTVTVQMNYLNKALDVFATSIVTPIYYVLFTTFVLIASSILYREWRSIKIEDMIGSLCGMITVIIGIFLLNVFKNLKVSWENIRNNMLFGHRTLPTAGYDYDQDPLMLEVKNVQPGVITWTHDDDEI